jgi:hypothetical protein
VRLIQAHKCIQIFAGQAQIFFPRKETKSHFEKKSGFNHFTCFAVLKLRGNNELEELSAEEETYILGPY